MSAMMLPTFDSFARVFSDWIDSLTNMLASVTDRFASPPTVRLVQNENGDFVVHSKHRASEAEFSGDRAPIINGDLAHSATLSVALVGNRVELVLQPDRFLFRPLELPKRASDFMSGVVRSQIDRLTPWKASDAAFGWSEPTPTEGDKLIATIAVTTVAFIKPYVDAMMNVGAHSIEIFVSQPESSSPEASPIKVWEQSGRSTKDLRRIRRALVYPLAAGSICAIIALIANGLVAMTIAMHQDELSHRISEARLTAGGLRSSASGSLVISERAIEQRKHDGPSSVLILENLSKILPDQTYVTELRLEGDKVRLTGVTRDAPSLIGLIEQSGWFSRATFFAPTTRSQSGTGDRFHIEAIIKTVGSST